MTALAVGDSVHLVPSGPTMTLTASDGTNATCLFEGRSLPFLLSQIEFGGRTDNAGVGLRIDNSATVTPALSPSDAIVQFTNATTTGFATRSICPAGQALVVTNSTGADFATGDFLIPNGATWGFYFDGTNWQSTQGV